MFGQTWGQFNSGIGIACLKNKRPLGLTATV